MFKSRVCFRTAPLGGLLVFALAASLVQSLAAQDDASDSVDADAVAKPTDEIIISEATTRFTGPLTEDGRLDLIAALNAIAGEGVTAENNAAIPLIRILGHGLFEGSLSPQVLADLGIEDFDPESVTFESAGRYAFRMAGEEGNRQFGVAMEGPWSREDAPLMHDWLAENDEEMDAIVEALQREHFYVPWRIPDGQSLVAMVLLSHIQSTREIARCLSVRANHAIAERDYELAWTNIDAMYRLSRMVTSEISLIEGLVGIAIDGMAAGSLESLLAESRHMDQFYRTIRSDLNDLPPLSPMSLAIDHGERAMMVDFIMSMSGEREAAADAAAMAELPPVALEFLKRSKLIDWNRVLTKGNEWYDEAVACLEIEQPLERNEAFEQLQARLDDASADLTSLSTLARLLTGAEAVVSENLANSLVSLLLPAIVSVDNAERRAAALLRCADASLAIELYRGGHGEYPDSLADLVPELLEAVPVDPFDGEPLRYLRMGEGFVVYAVGLNQNDDLGHFYDDLPAGDDPSFRVRAE